MEFFKCIGPSSNAPIISTFYRIFFHNSDSFKFDIDIVCFYTTNKNDNNK